jgi:hypothetical protein
LFQTSAKPISREMLLRAKDGFGPARPAQP